MPLVFARSDLKSKSARVRPIEIGLLNNLGDAGLETGDRQIVDILREAAGTETVRIHFFSLPTIPRSAAGRAHIAAHYSDFAQLRHASLDGLFITGCEPRMDRLPDESFWRELTDVIDWAEHNTRSTVFSCLAAHAAVLHLDGIERRRLDEKCTGLFHVKQAGGHPLLEGAPKDLRVPHSRYNDLELAALEAAGYQVLTSGPAVGVDTFVKSWRSLFIYLQGHPEYDDDALRREYRRDVLRFLERTSDDYPNLPVGYFDPATERRLQAFASEVQSRRDPVLLEHLPIERRAKSASQRRAFATALFRNWLLYLRAKTSNHAA